MRLLKGGDFIPPFTSLSVLSFGGKYLAGGIKEWMNA